MKTRDPVVEGLKKPISEVQKPIANQLLAASLKEVKLLEDCIFEILNKLNIEGAEGDLLDKIGALVGAYRSGRVDSDFRDYIYLRIAINTADGQLDRIIQITKILTKSTVVSVQPVYPAGLNINVNGTVINDFVTTAIQRITAAGVSVSLQGTNGRDPIGLADGSNKQHQLSGSKGLSDDGVAEEDKGFLVDALPNTKLNSPILEAAVFNAEDLGTMPFYTIARIMILKNPSIYSEIFNARLDVVRETIGTPAQFEAEALVHVITWEDERSDSTFQDAQALSEGLATSDNKTRYLTRLGLI